MTVIPLIIILNGVVYLSWYFGLQWMPDHFLVSWTALAQGRIWTLLTSLFSHNLFWHFFINMFVLNSFGIVIERILGLSSFVKFYLAAGVIASLAHAAVSAWILHEPDIPALGASGAISAIVILFALMFPRQKILLMGLIPIPAIWGAIGFIGLDVWGLMAQAGGGGLPIGHGAHLGGALTGMIYYYFLVQPKTRRYELVI